MVVWVQVFLGIISLGREVLKYMREQEENKKLAAQKFVAFNRKVKMAVKGKNTNDLSEAFKSIGIGRVQDGGSDQGSGNSGT